ncbi:hypothetical protein P389DRAFT_104751 [Cystobasidium minutum MCA 4210]|uniref:uncharacterized protein n=1 Tax=Cystobasidium minutum MCA 4210 TaxID=1397322 RepID=UPI0034CF29C4|eukprot:jgi/Rhomi1/104751/CE104750_406
MPVTLSQDDFNTFYGIAPLSFVDVVPPYLECSICSNTLRDPVCCTSGLHTFCKRCLTRWVAASNPARCPIDREVLPATARALRSAPLALQECIEALHIHCSLACGWQGRLGEWKVHLRLHCNSPLSGLRLEGLLYAADQCTPQWHRPPLGDANAESATISEPVNPAPPPVRAASSTDILNVNRAITSLRTELSGEIQDLRRQIEALQARQDASRAISPLPRRSAAAPAQSSRLIAAPARLSVETAQPSAVPSSSSDAAQPLAARTESFVAPRTTSISASPSGSTPASVSAASGSVPRNGTTSVSQSGTTPASATTATSAATSASTARGARSAKSSRGQIQANRPGRSAPAHPAPTLQTSAVASTSAGVQAQGVPTLRNRAATSSRPATASTSQNVGIASNADLSSDEESSEDSSTDSHDSSLEIALIVRQAIAAALSTSTATATNHPASSQPRQRAAAPPSVSNLEDSTSDSDSSSSEDSTTDSSQESSSDSDSSDSSSEDSSSEEDSTSGSSAGRPATQDPPSTINRACATNAHVTTGTGASSSSRFTSSSTIASSNANDRVSDNHDVILGSATASTSAPSGSTPAIRNDNPAARRLVSGSVARRGTRGSGARSKSTRGGGGRTRKRIIVT